MDRYCRWDIKSVVQAFARVAGERLECERGQSTVEYAIVLTAFLGIIVAIGLLGNALGDGLFIDHAIMAASHNIGVLLGGGADVFSY